jgi:hypothetical protein
LGSTVGIGREQRRPVHAAREHARLELLDVDAVLGEHRRDGVHDPGLVGAGELEAGAVAAFRRLLRVAVERDGDPLS